jgi:hypothetical protein
MRWTASRLSVVKGPTPSSPPSGLVAEAGYVKKVACFQDFLYGAYRDRTGDLRLAKPALSQLS